MSVRVLLASQTEKLTGPPCSGTQEVPVFGGWFLHVGPASRSSYNMLHISILLPVGNL